MLGRRLGRFHRGALTLLVVLCLCLTVPLPAEAGAITYRGFPTVDLYVDGHPVHSVVTSVDAY